MASYMEVRPDEEEEDESDLAQPSTSSAASGSTKVRGSEGRHSSSRRHRHDSGDPNSTDGESDITAGHSAASRSAAHSHSSRSARRKSSHHSPRHHSHHHNHSNGPKNHVQMNSVRRDNEEYKEPEHGTEAEVREYDFCMKTPMSTGHIIDLRGREVLFAIGVFFFLSVSVGLIVVIAQTRAKEIEEEKTENGKAQICFTKDCLARGAEMLTMMDRSVQPCSDFWRFACGGWVDQAEIPKTENTWGVSKELTHRINEHIVKILQSDTHSQSELSSERKMKIIYRQCMDLDAIDDLGISPLVDIMDNVGGWALFDDWNLKTKPSTWGFLKFLKELHHEYYIRVLFTMFVHPTDKGGEKNLLQFDQSVLPYADVFHPYMSDPDLVQSYRNYIWNLASLFKPTTANLEQFVNDTLAFERRLAQIHNMDEMMMNPQDNYNSVTVRRMQVVAPKINWLDYIGSTFPEISSDSIILVTDLDYFRKLNKLLQETSDRVLNYYMMWRLLDDFAPNLPEEYRKEHQTFNLYYTGRDKSKKESRQTYCVDQMGKMFGFELGSSFVKKYFPPTHKQNVQTMIGYIRDKFHKSLNDSSWLSKNNITQDEAMAKVKAMKFHVGYPDFIEDQSKVDSYYESFAVNEGDSFFQLLINYYSHERELSRKDLKGTLRAPEWAMEPYAVNAYTNPFDNTIVLPAGVLQSPHYDNRLPRYVNYGSFGSVIAHEMMHAFDGTGANFDSRGAMRMWWDMGSTETYNTRMKCVADYYSSMTYRNHKINGTLTENENLADIEGLRLAYDAYQVMMKNNIPENYIPGLDLSQNQTFFLAFAQDFCKIRKSEDVAWYLENSHHMIEEIRVIGTLAQVPAFAEAFNCKVKTRMNPETRCNLWT